MITAHDFQNFADFALPLINRGSVDSLGELVHKWEAQREHEEVMEDIRQGFEDIEAGRGIPLAEAMAQIRQQLGLKP